MTDSPGLPMSSDPVTGPEGLFSVHRRRLVGIMLSERGRPLRFIITGGLAACSQLVILQLLSQGYNVPLLANAVALVISAQVNFALSYVFTWRDRRQASEGLKTMARRWGLFHSSIAGTAALNWITFAVAHNALATIPAAALGILVASIGNFVMGDRLVFQSRRSAPGS